MAHPLGCLQPSTPQLIRTLNRIPAAEAQVRRSYCLTTADFVSVCGAIVLAHFLVSLVEHHVVLFINHS